jgi:hypothetical protein
VTHSRRRGVLLFTSVVAVASLFLSGCAKAKLDCTAFNKTFDQLQAATLANGALIINRGVCHSQIVAERKAQCPEYYAWLTTAKNFSAFVASETAGCVADSDKANARQDFLDLQKPDAFPVK